MPRLRDVEIYPATGFPDRLWNAAHGGDPVEDAFLRSSRGVAELYSESLRSLNIKASESLFRLMSVRTFDADRRSDAIEVAIAHRGGGESGRVLIPDSASRRDGLSRAKLALAVIHQSMSHLAEVRGWDIDQFDQCVRHVEDNGYEFSWASAWKSSPGRRFQARAAFRLPPLDGFGRVWLEVRSRGGDEVIRSPEATAFCTSAGFERAARTMRWADPSAVALAPYVGLLGTRPESNVLSASLAEEAWRFELHGDVAVRIPSGLGVGSYGEERNDDVPPIVFTCC